VESPAGRLRVTPSCSISLDEVEWRFSASGGPGGQHANTSNTRVELVFDVSASRSLGPRQRARVLERLGPVVRVVSSSTRSQARNRDLALARLRDRLAAALQVQRTRVPTKTPNRVREQRLETKRRRSDVKRGRRPPAPDD
jgi:ribosome-associated protein